MTKILTHKVISEMFAFKLKWLSLLKRAFGLHGAKMPNRTDLHQNRSNEYKWFYVILKPAGLGWRKCSFCIMHGCRQKHLPDNHIWQNTIFRFSSYPCQTINSMEYNTNLLGISFTKFSSMVKSHLKYPEFKIIFHVETGSYKRLKFIENIKMSETVSWYRL